jgi:DNA-binding MarR family transcriptional regulator
MIGEGTKERKRNLTSKEVDVLKLLYRFRFATNDNLAAAQAVHPHTVRLRAVRLVEMGYVTFHRDGRARVEGKPGVYVLSSKGATFLKNAYPEKYKSRVMGTIINSKNATPGFINRNLTIFDIYNRLNERYGTDLVFLTKSTMQADKFDFLPEIKPDVFMQIADRHFFLYYLETSTPDFAHVRRFKPLFDYAASGIWENATGKDIPLVLFVAENKRLETYSSKRFNKIAIDLGSDLKCATTTIKRLMNEDGVWSTGDVIFDI